jgi:uncharacterized membrane protein YeiH
VRYLFEHFAVAVCAITGVLAATNKRVDLFGVLVLALVTALGGGTLRDLILGTKPFWLVDSSFVLTASMAAGVIFLVARFWDVSPSLLLVPDACGLALFTVIGTEKALALSAPKTVAVMLGVITGVAGGMIRDLLTGEIPLVLRTGVYLYATAALCGASTFVLIAPRTSLPLVSESVAVAVILSLRLAAMRWRLSLPEYKTRASDKTNPS